MAEILPWYLCMMMMMTMTMIMMPSCCRSLAPTTTKTTKPATKSSEIDDWKRREWIAAVMGSATGALMIPTNPCHAIASSTNGLAAKLSKRDASVLVNPIFNVPPGLQIYPEFLRGTWDISCRFGGFLFPSQKIPKDVLTANAQIPGFQKCSIAALCDVGKDVTYQMKIDERTGIEDRKFTLTNQINANLDYSAVKEVIYNGNVNPNRLSIDFVDYRTRNAERIELFCNARESELIDETGVFVCSEYIRQVTFGTGAVQGVPRQVGGNYAHFWTWRKNPDNPSSITGNLLTASYLDPQDPLFFQEPSRPVAVYSHVLSAVRKQ